MRHQQLLDTYSASVSPTSRRELTRYMAVYLTWLGDREPTMDTARAYIQHLRPRYAGNTLHKQWETIRQLYKVNGIPWEVRRGDAPVVDPQKVWPPSLSREAVIRMIRIARGSPGVDKRWKPDVRDICFLFMSTTWGPRREELVRMKPDFINHKSSLIYIDTAKKGRPRWHWVPPDLMHYVTDWGFAHPTSLATASEVFSRWRWAAGMATDQKLGWHSIRRSLIRQLSEAGVPEERRKQFMRWAIKGGDMGQRYGTAPVVGLSETRMELVVDERLNDEFILEHHPFLPCWRGGE